MSNLGNAGHFKLVYIIKRVEVGNDFTYIYSKVNIKETLSVISSDFPF